MDVQDIVNTVSQKAGLDQATTEKVIGTIFSVLTWFAAWIGRTG